MGLSFNQMFEIGSALQPMAGDLQAAFAEFEKIEADPAIKQAIITAEKYLNDPALKAAVATVEKALSAITPILQGG